MRALRRNLVALSLAAGIGISAGPAAGAVPKAPPNPTFAEECGACHLAYPPRFLTAPSWERLMTGLNDHFGTDAGLEPAVTREITAWLVANARRPKAGKVEPVPPPLRITETRWFRGEHDEISPERFRSPAVGGAANCAACHRTAEQGNFSERNIKLPPK